MDYTKEIRPDDKKRVKTGVKTPINRRSGWVPGGSVVCWRMLACWRMVWAAAGGCWWSAGDGWAAVIRRYLIGH